MKAFTPEKVFKFLLGSILLLLILHIVSYVNFYINDLPVRDLFFRKLNFAEEKNVPSIFSSLLHFGAGLLLLFIIKRAFRIEKKTYFWLTLGLLFIFLGLDELLRWHEELNGMTTDQIEVSGIFYYAWVIPYGILVIVGGLLYLKPLLRLPKRTVRTFILAGVIFLIGAVGFEMAAGWYIDTHQVEQTPRSVHRTIPIFVLYTFEETLEMLGMSLFIFEILRFRRDYTYDKADNLVA